MPEAMVVGLERLSDVELLERLSRCAAQTRGALVELLRHLAEVDRRRLYLAQGCSSLFAYVVEVLHFSEGEAAKRIQAARLGARLPEVFEKLAAGELHLSGVVLMAPHLEAWNVTERLGAATHRTKREIEGLVAAWSPRPDAVARLARLPEVSVQQQVGGGLFDESSRTTHAPVSETPMSAAASAKVSTAPRASVTPLAPERFRLQVTLSADGCKALHKARALMKHKNPGGDLSVLIEEALAMFAEKLERRRFGKAKEHVAATEGGQEQSPGTAVAQSAPSTGTRLRSRYVPASIRRAVAERDAGRCAYTSPEGRRCSATMGLEVHHLVPFARGGAHAVDNLALRCRAHNAYAAEQDFGRELVVARIARRRGDVHGPSRAG